MQEVWKSTESVEEVVKDVLGGDWEVCLNSQLTLPTT